MAKSVGNSGKVFVFEPYIESYRIMRKNIYINNLEDRVFTYNLAASDQKTTGRMTVDFSNTGGSHTYENVVPDNTTV